jgi:hypothetical protein
MEMLGGLQLEHLDAYDDHGYLYVLINHAEEGLEMVGSSLFLVAILDHLLRSFGSVGVSVRPARSQGAG